MSSRRSSVALLLVALVIGASAYLSDVNPALAQTQPIGAWRVSEDPGLDGSAPAWQSVLPIYVPTTAQQVTPPMGGGGVQRVGVRALHWEDRLYVMLEWFDSTADQAGDRPEAFTDAAAVQFPAVAASTVPAICMGQADQAVNIWQWRADQQVPAPELPEQGVVDMYPSTEDLYYTARAAGNPLSQEVRRPVHNLVAGGFGTLTADAAADLDGLGVHSDGRWMVVFTRPLLPSGELQPDFTAETAIDVAFALWNGSAGERDGIKSVSAFTRLTLSEEAPPRQAVAASGDWPAYQPPNPAIGVFTLVVVGIALAMVVGRLYLRRSTKVEGDGGRI